MAEIDINKNIKKQEFFTIIADDTTSSTTYTFVCLRTCIRYFVVEAIKIKKKNSNLLVKTFLTIFWNNVFTIYHHQVFMWSRMENIKDEKRTFSRMLTVFQDSLTNFQLKPANPTGDKMESSHYVKCQFVDTKFEIWWARIPAGLSDCGGNFNLTRA